MKLYHRTAAAAAILKSGFEDRTGSYLTSTLHTGVWFADRPLDINDGADGDTLLAIEMPEEVIREYEWIEERKSYREWLIPAALANQHGPTRVVSSEEESAIILRPRRHVSRRIDRRTRTPRTKKR